jgi:hypothetical protein
MLTSVHRRPPPYVSWADRDGWVSADTREPRRMRPHLRPAGPDRPCRQRGPHPAACTVPVLACSYGRASRPDDAGRRGTSRHHRVLADLPAQVSQAPGHTALPAVAHCPRTRSADRRVCMRGLSGGQIAGGAHIDQFCVGPVDRGSTGSSTALTQNRPHSLPGSKGTRWTWTRSEMTWQPSSTWPWRPPMSRCGYARD